ncbi:MAG: rod shape-determining protein MreC [Fusobacteria bacterium]|nr:rod shape-determining protein MreC [Fusobacteriota bacterium]
MKIKRDKKGNILYKALILFIVFIGIFIFRNNIISIGNSIGRVFYPIKEFVYKTTYDAKSNITSLKNINDLIKETRRLQVNNYELELKLLEYKELEKENRRLKEILNIVKDYEYRFLIANVQYRDAMSIYEMMYIDKGSDDGVTLDMVAIKDGALLGRVVYVDSKKSKIDLITKNEFKVSAVSKDKKNLGILSGKNRNKLDLNYVIVDADMEKGDEIYTSGISNIFPKNILIGKISKVEKSSDNLYKKIEISLPYSFIDINEVILLKVDLIENSALNNEL